MDTAKGPPESRVVPSRREPETPEVNWAVVRTELYE